MLTISLISCVHFLPFNVFWCCEWPIRQKTFIKLFSPGWTYKNNSNTKISNAVQRMENVCLWHWQLKCDILFQNVPDNNMKSLYIVSAFGIELRSIYVQYNIESALIEFSITKSIIGIFSSINVYLFYTNKNIKLYTVRAESYRTFSFGLTNLKLFLSGAPRFLATHRI